MSPHRADFETYKQLTDSVDVMSADGKSLTQLGIGNVRLHCSNNRRVIIRDVLHTPRLERRLLSVAKLTKNGLTVTFTTDMCAIARGKEVVLHIAKANNVYKMNRVGHTANRVEMCPSDTDGWDLWHARLGHTSHENYRRITHASEGIPDALKATNDLCGGCVKGKHTVVAFPVARSRGTIKSSRVLQLVHTDVMSPMRTQSTGGAKYVLLFIDDFSRFISVYFLRSKSQVADRLRDYKMTMENQLHARIQFLRSDNGSEYVNQKVQSICRSGGIIHQRSIPYSPQQNGLAERTNRTVMEMARTMMMHQSVPTKWWADAINTAVYLLNRTTSTVHPETTPYEICHQVRPSLAHLKVFGARGFGHIDKSKRGKLDAKAFPCMHLGYSEHSKGYRVVNLDTGKIMATRSIRVDERAIGETFAIATTDVSDAYRHVPFTTDMEDDGCDVDLSHYVTMMMTML
ncbi:TPA: hypothetical protein N0F65_004758 [Lagenidium giganteum]|uniref:Integrase catalytic domain-containing protein n=1 Tax=Lagenidium giganteum TaxID=4803 RepID=A0AAV2YV91_9STRA|nr:TPA: hypothetical protein N0F65_004758 [Lagenidium giganteum]